MCNLVERWLHERCANANIPRYVSKITAVELGTSIEGEPGFFATICAMPSRANYRMFNYVGIDELPHFVVFKK